MGKIFENLAVSSQTRANPRVATHCRSMRRQRVTRAKRPAKWPRFDRVKRPKKGFDRSVDSPVELHFDFCFQQNAYGGWVGVLRDAGRGLWRAERAYRRDRRNRPSSPSSRGIGKSKSSPLMNADDTNQESVIGRIARWLWFPLPSAPLVSL